ncbi:MAG: 2-dehydropantoate 2-reductase [Methanobacteriaceae archaeon]|nr:2-dehydropantoate 2-reductase [Methanobacteriaceae archaeon]
MNILIDGAGAIGIGLGASMLSQNVNVSFFAKGETSQKLKKEGIRRTGIFKHFSFKPEDYTVYTDYKNMPSDNFDFVFVCSKTISNEDISNCLNDNKNILKDNAKIIIFQNGFGNDEPYLRYFSKDEVFCARVITGFKRPERNISEVTVHTEPILLGSLQGVDVDCLKVIADKISLSGIPCEISNDLDKWLWAKMLYNCALNPLGAVLGVNYGKLIENEYSINIMNCVIEEIFEVMDAVGYRTNWSNAREYEDVFYSKLVPDTYNHVSSTLQDIQRKKKTEIDSLTGKVIFLGEKYGVDVPINKTLYNLIKTIEINY